LIKEAVDPFLRLDKIKNYLIAYEIEFNQIRGDNIKIKLYTSRCHSNYVVTHLRTYFNHYFKRFEFKKYESIRLPIKSMFLPFPSNSIRFGLYKNTYLSTEKDQIILEQKIKRHFSRTLISIFKTISLNELNICAISIFIKLALNSILVKYKMISKNSLLEECLFLQENNFLPFRNSPKKFIKHKFRLISKLPSQIVNLCRLDYVKIDCINTACNVYFKVEENWISDWLHKSETSIKLFSEILFKDDDKKNIPGILDSMYNRQICISDRGKINMYLDMLKIMRK